MANTPFLDLVKPAGTDHALVSVINSNSDKIDTGVSTLSDQIGNILPSTGTTISNDYFNMSAFCAGTIKGIHITSAKTVLTKNTAYSCGTLDSKFRPVSDVQGKFFGNTRDYQISITSGGAITITPLSDMPGSAANVYSSFVYC